MDYLQPIQILETTLSHYRRAVFGLLVVLGLAVVVVPKIAKESNPVLIQTESGFILSKLEPWTLAASRMEAFTKAYLTARFDWDETTFDGRRKDLASLLDGSILVKLKDSTNAFEALARNQKAHSYYVYEGYGFSNAQHKIEARMIRVLRIQNAAFATPLIVRIVYSESALSAENPYGLTVSSLDEVEVSPK